MRVRSLSLLLMFLLALPLSSQAAVVLASGAGYRSVVDDLVDAYHAQTGNKVELIYGNMARVIAQARVSGAVDLVLGDASFFKRAKLGFATTTLVGRGKLVVAYPKGSHFTGANDLLASDVSRIAIPDTSRAIYGKAAIEYLKNKGVYDGAKPNILVVSTVPQAGSYIVAGEVDFAFINLTHARKIEKSIGGYTIVDEKAYLPIKIVVGEMASSVKIEACADFLSFLDTEGARKIVAEHGM
ncbi:molybdate ABC transporter substrate-binding protein [Desulfotalea psychrophila]|uniref:Related to molybdenum ABC transporter, periplasmic substrate binding protein n=1 Tax=Desulfotalea psychrophila (strain LSv54 / DSM 12343) TaxID=177439 RepID=Q6AR30_DESPS|nr:molybdate ABC transporter substrate-binding protein [Desulfotalea psychrophila]CAG35194.1 related to molybdenum ABC transporter, periplasmic substrate binding protein [Desulfotalea psychrophila LSv54]